MHMADALISVGVGGTMIAASAGIAAVSVKKVKKENDEKKIPLMGVMGAFVFASQMINFSIPGTGSSGHLAGALLLSIILGPFAGFITMTSVLVIQALFFGDGGLLALGCNVFNMAFYTCFIAYPFIYRPLSKGRTAFKKVLPAGLLAAIVGIQLGAFSVVIQTLLSGKTELPFGRFVMLMQPIHLAIAVVEGIITAAVVVFVSKARPDILDNGVSISTRAKKGAYALLMVSALLIAGFVSWFASASPDGLEWSLFKTSGQEELTAEGNVHTTLGELQEKTSVMPDYSLGDEKFSENLDLSAAGIIGVLLTLLLLTGVGFIITRRRNAADDKVRQNE